MMPEAVTQTRYRVEGMNCAGCAAKIDRAVRRLPGIADVSVSATAGTLLVQRSAESALEPLERAVTGLGYGIARGASPAEMGHQEAAGHDQGSALHGHDHCP